MEVFDISKYPEVLDLIASKMDLPMEDPEARKNYVLGIIGFIAGL